MKRWKHWNLAIALLLVSVLACAGCAGAGAGDKNNGASHKPPGTDGTQGDAEKAADADSQLRGAEKNDAAPDAVKDKDEDKDKTPGDADDGDPKATDDAAAKAAAGENGACKPASSDGDKKSAPAAKDTPAAGPAAAKVSLWVTRDFAQGQIYGQQVAVQPGDSVMDILKNNLKVETEYGGGFVQSIGGLSSGYTGGDKTTRDWFYYANGIITAVGALDYAPVAGDIIWWDYHDWGDVAFTPAVIGAFPQPFVGGYRGQKTGTVVLTAPGHQAKGQQLAQYLRQKGAANVTVADYNEKLVAQRNKITLVVGLWEQLAGDQYWQGLQKQRKKTGLFVEFDTGYFAALDVNGKTAQRYEQNVGAIVATGSGMGDPTPVWLIAGLDQAGLDQAVQVFTDHPQSFKQCFAALVSGHKVVALPVAR